MRVRPGSPTTIRTGSLHAMGWTRRRRTGSARRLPRSPSTRPKASSLWKRTCGRVIGPEVGAISGAVGRQRTARRARLTVLSRALACRSTRTPSRASSSPPPHNPKVVDSNPARATDSTRGELRLPPRAPPRRARFVREGTGEPFGASRPSAPDPFVRSLAFGLHVEARGVKVLLRLRHLDARGLRGLVLAGFSDEPVPEVLGSEHRERAFESRA